MDLVDLVMSFLLLCSHILQLLQSQLLTFWSKSQSDRKLKKNIAVLWKGLSKISGLTNASNAESPIVYLRLKKSTGSMQDDLHPLEDIAERVLREDSVFVFASKRSTLDKCRLPVGIILYVSAVHSESDLRKASASL